MLSIIGLLTGDIEWQEFFFLTKIEIRNPNGWTGHVHYGESEWIFFSLC